MRSRARRATGTGGNIEPTSADELTQLQRFIDYGVVTGIDSPSDVLPLEQATDGLAAIATGNAHGKIVVTIGA